MNDHLMAQVYYAAAGLATLANSSKGLPPEQITVSLEAANRRLQNALRALIPCPI